MAPRPVERYERIDVPANFTDLAKRRTAFLFQVMRSDNVPMHMVLASAYLQGLGDAADALENKAKRLKEEPPAALPWQC